jgi:polyisoprenoid-binding protein YceI
MALHSISSAPKTLWEIDPENTTIEFAIGKPSIHRVRGQFNGVRGWAVAFGETADDALIQVEIDAASIDTRLGLRDWHLRTGQFLGVERFPTISFTGTGVEDRGQNGIRVFGDLTIRGITRPISLDAAVERHTRDRARITAHTVLDHRDFKIGPKGMGLVVGNAVAVQLDLTLRVRW